MGVEEPKRQAIAGRSRGTVLNIHYTSHAMQDLKAVLDQVDFRLTITWSTVHGFPVITGCGLAEPMVDVGIVLAGDGGAASVSIGDSTRPELIVTIAGGTRPRKRAVQVVYARDAAEAARLVQRALRGRKPRPLRDPARQRAFEHLLMLAHPANAAPEPAMGFAPQ